MRYPDDGVSSYGIIRVPLDTETGSRYTGRMTETERHQTYRQLAVDEGHDVRLDGYVFDLPSGDGAMVQLRSGYFVRINVGGGS